jgi:hypothetical protein
VPVTGNDKKAEHTQKRLSLRQDHLHETSDQQYKKLMKSGTCFVTTSSVIDETANALSDPAFRPSVITFHRNHEN